jgi:hypothetical protein
MLLMIEKIMMKKIVILILLLFSFQIWTKAEKFDGFEIKLKNASSDYNEHITIYMGDHYVDGFNLGEDALLLNQSGFSFSILSGEFQLGVERRPYEGRYYLDFPLYMKLEKGQYTLTTISFIDTKATLLRFIDKTQPDVFVNLLENEEYSFTVDADKVYDNRFVIRVYAACLFKKDADSSNWTDADNWLGGVPGINSNDDKINNCAVLPEGANVILPANTTLTIGALLNGGELTIQEGAVLTVNNGVKLAPVSEIY